MRTRGQRGAWQLREEEEARAAAEAQAAARAQAASERMIARAERRAWKLQQEEAARAAEEAQADAAAKAAAERQAVLDVQAAANAQVGMELVGSCISIEWPADGQMYIARVLNFAQKTQRHLIVYDYSEDYATEWVGLRDVRRLWEKVTDPYANMHTEADEQSPHAIVGKIVSVDPNVNDSVAEARRKVACVLQVVHPQTQGGRGRLGKLTCAPEKSLLHKVVWIHGCDMDNVDFNVHTFTILP